MHHFTFFKITFAKNRFRDAILEIWPAFVSCYLARMRSRYGMLVMQLLFVDEPAFEPKIKAVTP